MKRSVQLLGSTRSHSEMEGICSFGGRLSAFAKVAARSVARRPILQSEELGEM